MLWECFPIIFPCSRKFPRSGFIWLSGVEAGIPDSSKQDLQAEACDQGMLSGSPTSKKRQGSSKIQVLDVLACYPKPYFDQVVL